MNIEKVERLVKCHADLVQSVKEFTGTCTNLAGRYVTTGNSDNAVEVLAKVIIAECGTPA